MTQEEAKAAFLAYETAQRSLLETLEALAREYMALAWDDYDNEDPDDRQDWEIEIEIPTWEPEHALWAPRVDYLAFSLSRPSAEERLFTLPIAYLWEDGWKQIESAKKRARALSTTPYPG